jgi:hypothetical protein
MSDFIQHSMNVGNYLAHSADLRLREPIKVAPGDIKDRMGDHDVHIVIAEDTAKVWSKDGSQRPVHYNNETQLSFAAHTEGVNGPGYEVVGGDTVPGLYLVGGIIPSVEGVDPDSIFRAYGRYAIELIEQQGQESALGRAGIMMHGGGSAAPDPLARYQGWYPTHGCVRLQNIVLELYVVPMIRNVHAAGGKVWVSVR